MAPSGLSALAALFRRLGIDWVLIGALAANRYRVAPRLTADVDLLLATARPDLEGLEAALRAEGWTVRRASADGEVLRIRHPDLGLADLLFADTQYQRTALERAHTERLDDLEVRVLTVEDVLVHKLIAGRSQDLADIEAILAAGAPLDVAYLERWIRFWEVDDLWQRLVASRHKAEF